MEKILLGSFTYHQQSGIHPRYGGRFGSWQNHPSGIHPRLVCQCIIFIVVASSLSKTPLCQFHHIVSRQKGRREKDSGYGHDMSHVASKECSKSTASTTSEKDNELLPLSSESSETTTTATTTIITNPGIAERLEQDIVGFESYGFSFHRRHGGDGTIGILIRSSSSTITSCCCLQIQVSNVSLMASIGPFLRTLVRLCIHPINPRCLHARIVLLDCNNNKTSPRSIAHAIHMIIRNSMGAALFMDLHIVLPRAAISTVHQQVLEVMKQNDDGCYEYPSVILHDAPTNEDEEDCFFVVGGCDHDRMMKKPFSIDLGTFVPNENDDTTNNNKKGTTTNTSSSSSSSSQPPCIRNPLTFTCLDEYDPQQHYLNLNVSTRMCTVRLTPLLFHLSQRLLLSFFHQSEPSLSRNTTTTTATFSSLQQEQEQKQQATNQDDNSKTKIILMVCLEKISNLYRVLMLIRDYYYYYDDDDDDNGSGGDKEHQQQQLQLVVVCKSSNIQQRFQSEANTFCVKNHIKLGGGNNLTIRILTIQTAKDFLIQQQQQQYDSKVRVIGFDLHDNARTLLSNHHHYGNDGIEMKNLLLGSSTVAEAEAAANGGNPTSSTITTTSIIILGFESDGIPKTIDEVITEYVQIESRTSINVVAAFSIVLHIVMTMTTT
eukprot:scaffold2638_cov114-Cylindrotheca_fusiformis.AAC.8